MRERVGEVRLSPGEQATVRVRRRWCGGWRGRVEAGGPSPARGARLLGLRDAVVVAGAALEVEARAERLRATRGGLAEAPVRARGDLRSSVLAPRDPIHRLPPHVRGVPAAVALAALARELRAPRRCAVFWSSGEHTLIAAVDRGQPHAGSVRGWPCLLLTHPDSRRRRLLRACGVGRLLSPGDRGLAALPALGLLALGVAWAERAPGTFPVRRGWGCLGGGGRWRGHVVRAAGLALFLAAGLWWWGAERELDALRARAADERRAVERLRWELAAPATDPVEAVGAAGARP